MSTPIVHRRKRPVLVDTMQWLGDNEADVKAFAGALSFHAVTDEDRYRVPDTDITAEVWDYLHSTWIGVKTGQHIARGVKNEHYPIDDGEVLAETYEDADTPLTIYRASHDSIVMGQYTTAAEARKHCETEERRSWPTGTSLSFDWIEDEEDGVAELVVVAGQNEESTTGYVVTALDVASKYDEEAGE